jgi:hypothetical protein
MQNQYKGKSNVHPELRGNHISNKAVESNSAVALLDKYLFTVLSDPL